MQAGSQISCYIYFIRIFFGNNALKLLQDKERTVGCCIFAHADGRIVPKLANWNAALMLQLLLFLLHHPIKQALNFVYKPLRE
jgi:hypothetical protein